MEIPHPLPALPLSLQAACSVEMLVELPEEELHPQDSPPESLLQVVPATMAEGHSLLRVASAVKKY
jgi:hypothetical protein